MAIANRFGILGFDDLAAAGTFSATFTPATGYPLTNLQNNRIFSTCRTASGTVTGVQFDIDLGANKTIDSLAMLWNPSDTATVRVRFSTVSNFATTTADSTAVNAFTLLPVTGTAIRYKQPWGRCTFQGFTSSSARYVRVNIEDSASVENQIILSIVRVGLLWTPAIAADLSTKPLPDLIVGEPGLQKSLRGHSASWKQVTRIERTAINEILRKCGTTTRFFVVPQPNTRDTHADELFWGVFESQLEQELFLKKTGSEFWACRLPFREVDE